MGISEGSHRRFRAREQILDVLTVREKGMLQAKLLEWWIQQGMHVGGPLDGKCIGGKPRLKRNGDGIGKVPGAARRHPPALPAGCFLALPPPCPALPAPQTLAVCG